jgi:hydroxyacylglutathione hydrolase
VHQKERRCGRQLSPIRTPAQIQSLRAKMPFDMTTTDHKTGRMSSLNIVQLPCLTDNYCVLLHSPVSGETAAIDAPQAEAIAATLDAKQWPLTDIFVTHHHNDHTGGCLALKSRYSCRITGSESEADRVPGIARAVSEGSSIAFAGHDVRVLETPGHTLGHVSYYFPGIAAVFTGDTLFALGCGRVFEGDAQTMYASLQKIAGLPDHTQIYCGHEYTLANGRFALSVEPENSALVARMKTIEALRASGEPTLPTTVALEKATNPFLRTHSAAIRARLGLDGAPDWQVFARLRELKNKA